MGHEIMLGEADKSNLVKHLVAPDGEHSADIVARADGKFRVIVNSRFGPGEDDWVGAKLREVYETIEAAEAVARRAMDQKP